MQNFGGFRLNGNDSTEQSFWDWVITQEFDLFGVPECNVNWKLTYEDKQFHNRYKERFPPGTIRGAMAYNIHRPYERKLWGGVSQYAINEAAFRLVDTGRDPTNLGRWCWQLMRGKNNHRLRVITAYRPNRTHISKTESPFAQQREYFNNNNKDRIPTSAILHDLKQDITKWIRNGEHIILLMDCNDDVRSPSITKFADECHLREIITSHHTECTPPRTVRKGTKPIDGIFASFGIDHVYSGYAAFNQGTQGDRADHRCLWIDVDIRQVFGHKLPPIIRMPSRRLKLSDPRTVKRFNEAYEQFIIDHRLLEKAISLEARAEYPLSRPLQQEAEKLDRLKQQGIRYADKRCRKLFMGGVPFSLTLKRLLGSVQFWKAIKKRKTGHPMSSRHIQRLAQEGHIEDRICDINKLSLDAITLRLLQAEENYYQFKNNEGPAEERQTWLQNLADARAAEEIARQDATSTQQTKKRTKRQYKRDVSYEDRIKSRSSIEIRQLRLYEKMRSSSRKINNALGKNRLAGVMQVEAPTASGQWVPVYDKDGIEQSFINENKRRFRQTEDTPFMTEPLRSEFGFQGIGPNARQVLAGSYQPPPTADPYAARLLRHLTRIKNTEPLPIGISTKDYIEGWNRAKERTSSGPSPIHFGHCKAAAYNIRIAQFEATMTSIPMKSGYAYRRWQKGIDVELKKKSDSVRVDKMRTIVLFEADFNFVNKAIGKKVSTVAEQVQGFATEQFGSRKRHKAIEHALNKRLTFDLIRLQRTPAAICTNDLKSCYDRIVHSVASICLQRFGVSESEVFCMFATIQNLEHCIRTAFGDSSRTYGGDVWVIPMQGVYQGNGAGPLIWAVVSSPLLEIMRAEGFGTALRASLDGELVRLAGYAFVDDTDLIQTATSRHDTSVEVAHKMQQFLDLWEGLVRATGGGLVVDKSTWWLVDFGWNDDGTWFYKRSDMAEASLSTRDFDGTIKSLHRSEPDDAFETLGVYLAPDGSQHRAYQELVEKAKDWSGKVKSASLNKDDVATALKTTILKSLEYPLTALSLTTEQCNDLMTILKEAALPKAGFVAKFPSEVLHGPLEELGLDLHHIYTTQLIHQLKTVLQHGEQPTPTGKLLRSTIQATLLEIGLGDNLFDLDYNLWGHLATDTWVTHLWNMINEVPDLHLHTYTTTIPLQRQNDDYIMACFRRKKYSKPSLQRLNRCRLFLQLATVSDITSGDGSSILPGILGTSNRRTKPTWTSFEWPVQGPLPDEDWEFWDQAIRRTFLKPWSTTLKTPLGHWLTHDTQWPSLYDARYHRLWLHTGPHWTCWQRLDADHPLSFSPIPTPSAVPPDRLCRSTSWISDDQELIFTGWAPVQEVVSPPPLISSVPPEAWELEYCEDWSNAATIAEGIKNGTTIAVTDGSYKEGRGTAGFIFHELRTRKELKFAHRTPGAKRHQSSYRSELGGIYGVISAVAHLSKFFDVSGGSLPTACDNYSAGERSLEWEHPPSVKSKQYDMLQAIHVLKNQISVQFTYHYVEGHQSDFLQFDDLDLWGQLNDRMDHLAKAYMQHTAQLPDLSHPVRPQEWAVTYQSEKISDNFDTILRRHIHTARLHYWYIHKKKFSAVQLQLLDYQALKQANKRGCFSDRKWRSKFHTNMLATGRNMKRRKHWDTDRCPRCSRPNENTAHILQCMDPEAIQQRNKLVEKFNLRLAQIDTHPSIRRAMHTQTLPWLCGLPPEPHYDPITSLAVQQQKSLGWLRFWQGKIVKGWRQIQLHYLQLHHRAERIDSWAREFILAIWAVSRGMWTHRNEILHGPKITPNQEAKITELDRQIRFQWLLGCDGFSRTDRIHFSKGLSLQLLLSKHPFVKKSWLSYVLSVRKLLRGNPTPPTCTTNPPNRRQTKKKKKHKARRSRR